MSTDFHRYAKQNRRRTALFVFYSFVLLGVMLSALSILYFGLELGTIISVSATVIIITILYFNASRVALGMTRAKEVSAEQAPQLHNIVDEMVLASGITKPRIYVIDDHSMNAFAAGTAEKGHVVFTRGLLRDLNREEVQGVAAHELAHLSNGDSKLMTKVAAVGLAIGIVADIGIRMLIFGGQGTSANRNGPLAIILLVVALLGIILAPILSLLIQASISREREWLADATAVNYTRNPSGLRSALEKLQEGATAPSKHSSTAAHLWIASPVNELKEGRDGRTRVKKRKSSRFDTHPPIAERIKRLQSMEA